MPGVATLNTAMPLHLHNNNAYAENSLALAQAPEMLGPFESQNGSETTSALQEPSCSTHKQSDSPGIPVDYFNSPPCLEKQQEQRVQVQIKKRDYQAILLSPQWSEFQATCVKAEFQLQYSLDHLKQSLIKNYLLSQDKKIVQEHIYEALKQVQVIHQLARQVTCSPTDSNWQLLKQALVKLAEISTAAPSPVCQTAAINFPNASAGTIARIWGEVQYFLTPVVITGWGILNKLGVLTEALTKNVPIVGGLVGLVVTTYQRIARRIDEIKSEDQKIYTSLCHSIKTVFETIEEKQMMQQVRDQVQVQTENTRVAAQQAANASWEVGELKKVVDDQSRQIAELKIQIEENKVAYEKHFDRLMQSSQQQANILFAKMQQLLQQNEAIEKKA